MTRDARLLFLARAVRMSGYGALGVILVLYLAAAGLDAGQVGVLLTLTLAGDTLISLWLTTHADRIGRRRTLVVGAVLMAGAGLVFAGSSGNFATVADAGAGATYAWSIANGTINAGQGQRTIHYSAGASGTVILSVTVSRNGCGPAGNANVAIQARPAGATMLYTIAPCRVADTRSGAALANAETRNFMLAGLCGIPGDAKAVVANITAVVPATNGWLALWPAGTPWGGTATVNYRTGKTRSNNAIVPVASDGYASMLNSGGPQHVIIDVMGYFR